MGGGNVLLKLSDHILIAIGLHGLAENGSKIPLFFIYRSKKYI